MLPVNTGSKEDKPTYDRIVEPYDLETTKKTFGDVIIGLASQINSNAYGQLRLNYRPLDNDKNYILLTEQVENSSYLRSNHKRFTEITEGNQDEVISSALIRPREKGQEGEIYKIDHPENIIVISSGKDAVGSGGYHSHIKEIKQIKSFLEKNDIKGTAVINDDGEPHLFVDVTQDRFISNVNDMYRKRAKHRVERARANIENTDPSKAKPPQVIIDELIEQYDLIPKNSLGKPLDTEQAAQTAHRIINIIIQKAEELGFADKLAKLQAEEKPRNFSTRVSASQSSTGLKKV
jgi:hypothetical protein